MASEPRISLEFANLDFTTAGKNASLVAGSLQIASSKRAFAESTSRSPISARGASRRVKEGLRRSQSTRITRAFVCAARIANAVEVVDLPSSGTDDVNPTILFVFVTGFTAIDNLTVRAALQMF